MPTQTIQDLVHGLNPKQKEAVLTEALNTLILAGAGSGKTRVLTHRIAKHVLFDGIPANGVMALTFTNKAAKEMSGRLAQLVGGQKAEQVYTGTFHSFCARLLRKNYSLAGLTSTFTILDPADQKSLLNDLVLQKSEEAIAKIKARYKAGEISERNRDEELKDTKEHYSLLKKAVKPILGVIDDLKNSGLGPKVSYDHFATECKIGLLLANDAVELFRSYEHFKTEHSMVDFNDLIIKAIVMLSKFEDLRDGIRSQFQAILVDEYQDTNALQFKLLSLIQGEGCLTTVVGDEDQSIYAWRGADIKHILNHSKRDDVNLIILDQNYRSTKTILNAANQVIAPNDQRIGKNLWTDNAEGDKIDVVYANNAFEEANYVAEKVSELHNRGVALKDIAVLYRNNFISSLVERGFHQTRISAVVHGGVGFWARQEVKAVMAFLKWANSADNVVALKAALGTQKCGYGDKTHLKLLEKAKKNNTSLEDEVLLYCTKGAKSANKEKVLKTLKIIGDIRLAFKDRGLFSAVEIAVDKTGIKQYFKDKEDDIEKYEERYQNIMSVLDLGRTFKNDTLQDEEQLDDMSAFISSADLQIEASQKKGEDAVTLMTVHASKGLEYKYIFLVGADQGVFPSFKNIEENNLEEERRLAYVAVTRAMNKLFITTSRERLQKPTAGLSEFIRDISDRYKRSHKIRSQWF